MEDSPIINRQVFDDVFAALGDHTRSVLVTGRAGTGKTTLIHELLADETVKQIVVAPTGVAALQARGQTIHSLFQIPPRLQNMADIKPVYGKNRQVIRNLDRLIIDEISMVRADLLDKVDYALRLNRNNKQPFGGVQLLLVGDFFQLPPVVPRAEAQMLEAMGYDNHYALGAKCLREAKLTAIELQRIFRQTEPEFIELLGHIRSGKNLQAAVDRLNEACVGQHREGHTPVLLTGTNAGADGYNAKMLAELPGPGTTFEGSSQGEFKLQNDQLPAPSAIELKVGARVMMLKNDTAKRWVNGSLATVMRIGQKEIGVMPDGDTRSYDVGIQKWERYRYNWNAETKAIDSEVAGTYSQMPVKLAWASTIHKAQGLSLENVRVNLKSGAFASGQVYVALSRATSLAGLSLTAPLSASDVIVDHRLNEMLSSLLQVA